MEPDLGTALEGTETMECETHHKKVCRVLLYRARRRRRRPIHGRRWDSDNEGNSGNLR